MIDLADLLAADPSATVLATAGTSFTGFAFDSRRTTVGQCFVALRTSRGDGHRHLDDARRAGAAGLVVDREVTLPAGITAVRVDDVETTLAAYARHMVRARAVRVVGVTGSVGKTSTKEAIAHVLASRRSVHRSPGNFTGQLGLPIALGDLEPHHEVSVLEMASGHPRELALLASIAPPEVAVITALSPVHMTAFGDLDALAHEYASIVEAVADGGLVTVAATDPRLSALTAPGRCRVVTCAVGADADYQAHDLTVTATGTTAGLVLPSGRHRVGLPWLGAHLVQAALHACAVADHFGIEPEVALAALGAIEPLPGRMVPFRDVDLGAGRATVVDDTFSASPASVAAALDTLAALPAAQRIAVVADMADLAGMSAEEHAAAGRHARRTCDVLVTLGREAARIADAAAEAGMPGEAIVRTYLPEAAARAVQERVVGDAVVLVKGGLDTHAEAVVGALVGTARAAAGVAASDLLVRSDRSTEHITVLQTERPTWLEIDYEALIGNVQSLQALAAPARLMVVLKGDAYGHGAEAVAHTVVQAGIDLLGVALISEAEALRASGIDCDILVLGPTQAWQARRAVRAGATVTVFEPQLVHALGRAASDLGMPVRVHVKVDTGMHRLGADPADVRALLEAARGHERLEVEGIFSHLARADRDDADSLAATQAQADCFAGLLAELDAAGLRPPIAHLLNTSGLVVQHLPRFDVVRCGLAAYGYLEDRVAERVALTPVLSWKSQIAQLRDLAPGEAVGYGGTWVTARPSRIATIPVGYGDGFRRGPRPWEYVLVRGERAPVVGRVSMDQTTIDVTGIPGVVVGDEVVLLGEQGDEALWAGTVAGWLGTNEYEVLTAILPRVPRIPRRQG